jgi:hypothetical protein
MARLIRTSATLIAVYSIVLQALISGFVLAEHSGFDPFAIICTAGGSADHQPTPTPHRSNCDACLAACSSSPALVPANVAFSPVLFPVTPKRPTFFVGPLSLQPRHQPHKSRAPPIPS